MITPLEQDIAEVEAERTGRDAIVFGIQDMLRDLSTRCAIDAYETEVPPADRRAAWVAYLPDGTVVRIDLR